MAEGEVKEQEENVAVVEIKLNLKTGERSVIGPQSPEMFYGMLMMAQEVVMKRRIKDQITEEIVMAEAKRRKDLETKPVIHKPGDVPAPAGALN